MSFAEYANQIVSKVEENFKPILEVDAFTFITSPEYMGETLFPFQSLIIKTFYSLWPIYPPTELESQLLWLLEDEWKVKIDINNPESISFLILVLGRRSGKSSLISFIATYEMYSLICKDNPQAYYNIRDRHPIHIMHVAAAGPQAEDVFRLTNDNIRRVQFFRKYIDFDKDNSSELRLFSPYDLRKNEEIRIKNTQVIRGSGIQKESLLPGSLGVESITTSAATNRGKAIKCLMLSEFAHFPRGGKQDDESGLIASENLRTDYAIWKALTPSVKDFGKDGRVLAESSPKEKGGEFYHHYCIGGGYEQDKFEEIQPDPNYQVIQLSTWQARPGWTQETFDKDFNKDPVGAAMEYGAHFGSPSGAFIQEEWIERVPQPQVQICNINTHLWKFVISIDPGGKAKKKKADTYAIAWGHVEGDLNGNYQNEGERSLYWVDGMKGFNSKVIPDGNGKYTQESVDPNVVMDYILNLIEGLGGRDFIHEITYDQWNSSAPIATLQGLGYPAIETTFTNPYKSAMYGNFLSKLITNQVRMYGIDLDGCIARWKLEMKYLQRITQGNYTFYQHPTSGPVQNDDYADVTAGLVHRLCLITTPTNKSIQEAHKQNVGPDGNHPIQVRRGPRPIRAGAINTSFNPYRR